MRKTLSGKFNLNNMPRRDLMNRVAYIGQGDLPTVRSGPYFAGSYRDSPREFATRDTAILSMRRQARPYGVF